MELIGSLATRHSRGMWVVAAAGIANLLAYAYQASGEAGWGSP